MSHYIETGGASFILFVMNVSADNNASEAEISNPANLPKDDPAEVKRRWLALLDEMETLPGPGRIQKREPIIFRDD